MPRVHLCKATQAYPGNIWWESPWPGKKGGHKSGTRCQAWSMRLSSSPECPAVCFPAGPTCLTSSVKTVAPPFQLFSKLKMSKLPQLRKDCGIMKFALVAFTCFLSQPSPHSTPCPQWSSPSLTPSRPLSMKVLPLGTQTCSSYQNKMA